MTDLLDDTAQVLRALWLDVHDDDTPEARAAALLAPMPFLTIDDVSEGDEL